jgi:hypothetical protein
VIENMEWDRGIPPDNRNDGDRDKEGTNKNINN